MTLRRAASRASSRPSVALAWLGCCLVLAAVLAACGSTRAPAPGAARPSATGSAPDSAMGSPTPRRPTSTPTPLPAYRAAHPLRPGERLETVRMPAAYSPSPPTGQGTDDYRCFLLDPKVAHDSFVTGYDVRPGNTALVHHVILFRVPPEQVREAEHLDAKTPGQGWTCFGNSGLGGGGANIDDAPWLGAWAPGGQESRYGQGLGEPFPAGSRIVMQVHYNLRQSVGSDQSAAVLRLATAGPGMTALQTQLLPAPVELPCRSGHTASPLCDRARALADVDARFGPGPGSTADVLHLLCGPVHPASVQSCTRPVYQPETIRGAAGHMHLLGRSIRIDVDPGTPRARTVLNIGNWDFDHQGSHPTPPIHLKPGDRVRVTCRHDQSLRDHLPTFAGEPDRYVVWGEGSTDEMCLGLLLVTRP